MRPVDLGSTLVRVHTDTGLVGIGESWLVHSDDGALAEHVGGTLGPLLVGEDALDTERLWYLMWSVVKRMGFTKGLSALQLSLGQLAAATILLTPVAAGDVAAGRVDLGPLGLLCLLLLGALGTGYAYLLNYRTVQEHGATFASLVTYLVPIVGVAAGVLVLGEPFSLRLVLGGLVIVAGVALVQGRLLGPRRPEPAAGRLPDAVVHRD